MVTTVSEGSYEVLIGTDKDTQNRMPLMECYIKKVANSIGDFHMIIEGWHKIDVPERARIFRNDDIIFDTQISTCEVLFKDGQTSTRLQ